MAEEDLVIKLRGLPWAYCKESAVRDFLSDCVSGLTSVNLVYTKEGRPSGEAYVQFSSEDDIKSAIMKDHEYIDSRYIEVTRVPKREMEHVLSRYGSRAAFISDDSGCVVKLRGLPYGCSHADIAEFFQGLEIAANGVVICTSNFGRQTGIAFVRFARKEYAELALERHLKEIGHRYIEVFRCSDMEWLSASMDLLSVRGLPGRTAQPKSLFEPTYFPSFGGYGKFSSAMANPTMWPFHHGGYAFGDGRGWSGYGYGVYDVSPQRFHRPVTNFSQGRFASSSKGHFNPKLNAAPKRTSAKHSVQMRGLPFDVEEEDIRKFFEPLQPIAIIIKRDSLGLPNGFADVVFVTHNDAAEAMKKDRENIGSRYIELTLNSSAVEKLASRQS